MENNSPRSSSSSPPPPNSTRSSLIENSEVNRSPPPSPSPTPTPFNSPTIFEQVMTTSSSSSSSFHNSTRSSLMENLQVDRSPPPSPSPTPFNSPTRTTSFSELNHGHITDNRVEEEMKIIDRLSLGSKDDTAGTSMKLETGSSSSKQYTRGQSVRTRRSRSLCETRTDNLSTSSELTNTSNYQELVTQNEHEVNQGHHHSISGDTVSSYGDIEIDLSKSTSQGERYFGNFVSGIEKKLEEREDAKAKKLKNKLRKKETKIDDWELKELERANSRYREAEERLERQRQEYIEKMQNRFRSVQERADAKRLKERQSATKKISTLSKVVDKLRSVGKKLNWWKKLFHKKK